MAGHAPEDPPDADALTLLSTVVAHPGSTLDALRLRARLAPAAFAHALGALRRASLVSLRNRTAADDPRAKAYPNAWGREVLAAAGSEIGRPAAEPGEGVGRP